MEYYITESTKKSNGRKYKCPYCDYRETKPKLVDHIEQEHEMLIPKDYTAARIVFNMVNKKDHGTCVCGCGRETAWREDLWRYDRYATEECKDKYSKEMKQRMIKTYGKAHLLNDEDVQKKMLNNRSISGTYKFSTGGTANYVGSYERKFLEFCDNVMNYRASDIQQPGLSIPYKYNGKLHVWITDFYIPAANLVIDVKDGGDNPNNREMKEYREKQELKEKALIDCGKYNYIRLTNNNFAQLMLILAEIKLRMLEPHNEYNKEDNFTPIIKINESVMGTTIHESSIQDSSVDDNIKGIMECILGITPNGRRITDHDIWVINYPLRGGFDRLFYTNAPDMERMITQDPKTGNIKLANKDMLDDGTYEVYKFNGEKYKPYRNPETIFEMLTGSELLDPDQIKYDSRFEQVHIPTKEVMIESVQATIVGDDIKVPTITRISLEESNINSYYDSNGIYIENADTGLRSKSYKNEKYISEEVIEYIRGGQI